MKLAQAITVGFGRAVRSIKPILIIWIFSVVGISVLILPIKSGLISDIGSSLGTDMIKDSFSVDFWTGLDTTMPMMAGMMKGFLYIILIFFFLNVFFNGGLFDALKSNVCGYSLKEFFRTSAANFFSFLSVTLLTMLMIIIAAGLIVGLPAMIARGSSGGEVALFKTLKITRVIFFLVLPIFLLVIDYSRAWLAANNKKLIFKSLGYGFKATFGCFLSSYLFMIIIMAVQLGFLFLASKAIGFKPESGGGLFVLFLLSQTLFIIKLFLRAWRYGGVSTMFAI